MIEAEAYDLQRVAAGLKERPDHSKYLYHSIGFVRKVVTKQKEKVSSLIAENGMLGGCAVC